MFGIQGMLPSSPISATTTFSKKKKKKKMEKLVSFSLEEENSYGTSFHASKMESVSLC